MRRSHCRLCGEVFCSTCCGKYLSVDQIGEGQRFCDSCYLFLSKLRQTKTEVASLISNQ